MAIEVIVEKRIQNAAVYGDVDTEQRRQYFLLVGLAALFMLGLLFYGWQQYQWRQVGYDIGNAEKRIEELTEHNKQLQLEHASKADLARIEKIATERLGMTGALPGQMVTTFAPEPPAIAPGPSVPEVPELTASKR